MIGLEFEFQISRFESWIFSWLEVILRNIISAKIVWIQIIII